MINIYKYTKETGTIKESHPDSLIDSSFDQETEYELVKTEEFSYKYEHRTYSGFVIRPLQMEQKPLPVLYLLHGLGGNNEWTSMGCIVNILNRMLKLNAIKRSFMVVLPNLFRDANESQAEKIVDYKAFVDVLKDENGFRKYINTQFYGLNEKPATAIAGLSMGGLCALYTATKLNHLFGSVGAFSPSGGLVSPSKTWLADYNEFTTALANDFFIFISKGTEDTVVGNQPIVYHDKLTNQQISNTIALYPGYHDWESFKKGLYLYLLNNIFEA